MKEPIYQELSEATLLRNNMTKSTPSPAIRVSFNDVNDEEEYFLKPIEVPDLASLNMNIRYVRIQLKKGGGKRYPKINPHGL